MSQKGGCIISRLHGSLWYSCYFRFSKVLSFATHKCQNVTCEPARVFLQKERQKPVFQGGFAGKQKSPPQPVSLFAPTNVGIDGVPDTIRTCDLQSRSLTLYPAELQVRMGAWKRPQGLFIIQQAHNFVNFNFTVCFSVFVGASRLSDRIRRILRWNPRDEPPY